MGAYDITDTIAAPATAPAPSALGIVRLAGPRAWEIAHGLESTPPAAIKPGQARVITLCIPLDDGEPLCEQAVITSWRAPHSYTGDDLVELSVHGSPLLVRQLLGALTKAGARPAEAGEFTYRAFVNGKLDLVQAEAVQQLITAGSTRALALAQSALAGTPSGILRGWVAELTRLLAGIEVIHDYAADGLDANLDPAELLSPDSLHTSLNALSAELATALADSERTAPLRDRITIALLGPPNVGKSTLFNALLGHERALTAAEPGTTRDYLTETVDTGGINLTLVDTAGYHDAVDAVEAAGVQRSGDWARAADRVLWVTAADGDLCPMPAELRSGGAVNVITRCDLLPRWPGMPPAEPALEPGDTFYVSGTSGKGVPALWKCLQAYAAGLGLPSLAAFGERQAARIAAAHGHLTAAVAALEASLPLDAVAQDLYAAVEALQGVYEQSDRASVISQIFSSFCVGK